MPHIPDRRGKPNKILVSEEIWVVAAGGKWEVFEANSIEHGYQQ